MAKPKLADLPAERAARRLLDSHERRERFAPLASELAPRTSEEAYAIQDCYVALRAEERGAIAGYKIALSSPEMQRFVGVDRPQAGVMLADTLHRTPARVRAADYVNLIVEFEIALEMAADLPAADAPYSAKGIAPFVHAVMPAIELADDRNANYAELAKHPLELIADNGWNEGAVLGMPLENWHGLDLAALRGVATINGKVVGEGLGGAYLGHPLAALAWIANPLAAQGRGLVYRDIVITGSMITTKTVHAGDLVCFKVAELGDVELRVD